MVAKSGGGIGSLAKAAGLIAVGGAVPPPRSRCPYL